MGGDVRGGGDDGSILGEEVPDVAQLGKEQKDPAAVSWPSLLHIYICGRGASPVDSRDSGILTERRLVFISLLPDLLTLLHIVR